MRAQMQKGGFNYSDDGASSVEFGPRSPVDELALDLLDEEAKWLGELALSAARLGIISQGEVSLKAFWNVRLPDGSVRCRGLRPSGTYSWDEIERSLREVCNLLEDRAVFFASSMFMLILSKARAVRHTSYTMFPFEGGEWGTVEGAAHKFGYTQAHIYDMIAEGVVRTLEDRPMLVSIDDIAKQVEVNKRIKSENARRAMSVINDKRAGSSG